MDTIKQFKKIIKLDKVTLEIFKHLSEIGKINYSKIGKELGVSHVSIKNRYEKLLKRNIIKPSLSVNFSSLSFNLAILDKCLKISKVILSSFMMFLNCLIVSIFLHGF